MRPALAILAFLIVAVVAVVLLTRSDPSPSGAVTTIGAGPPGTLRLPQAIAVTAGGEVVVGDQFSGVLTRFGATGRPLAELALPPDPGLGVPAVGGVEPLPGGDVLVADSLTSTVRRLDATGRAVTTYAGAPRGLHFGYTPYIGGLAGGDVITAHGEVVVADSHDNRLVVFAMDGRFERVLELPGSNSLPQGIAASPAGVYVADDTGNRILELDLRGRVLRTSRLAGHTLDHPYDVAVGPGGEVVVADNSNHAVVVLDRRLRWVRSFGREGSGRGRLRFPRAVAVDRRGRVLVADTANSRVAMFDLRGRWLGVLGVDGRRADVVTRPVALSADRHGELRVADGVTGRISRFTLGGRLRGTMGASQAVTDPVRRDGALAAIAGVASAGTDGRVVVLAAGGPLAFGADGQLRPHDALVRRLRASIQRLSVIGSRPDGGLVAIGRRAGRPTIVTVDRGLAITRRALPADAAYQWSGVADGGDGSAWAVSRSPGRAVHVSRTGAVLASVALPSDPRTRRNGFHGAIEGPEGVAVDADGHAWVVNAYDATVVELGDRGKRLRRLGGPGRGRDRLRAPSSIAVDCAGGVVVGDTGNVRVVRFAAAAAGRGCAGTLPAIPAGRGTRLGVDLRTIRGPVGDRAATWLVRCSRACTVRARASVSMEFDLSRAIAEHAPPSFGDPIAVPARASARRAGPAAWRVTVDATAAQLAAARSRAPQPALSRAVAHVVATDARGLRTTVDLSAPLR